MAKNQKGKTETYSIGRSTVPLNEPIEITLKGLAQRDDPKISLYRTEGRSHKFIGGNLQRGRMQFTTAELGDFVLMKDSIAPLIYRIQCQPSSARFRIMDNLSGIASYEATVDGEWLLMKYDYKTGILQSERLDKTKRLHGDFELKVYDNVGNEKIFKQKIL